MPAKRRFIPRTLTECHKALGEIDQPDLRIVLQDGHEEAAEPESQDRLLFKMLGKPRSGDWLESHEEFGQSFPQYAKRMNPKMGNLPRPACKMLLVVPLGKSFSSEVGVRMMPHLLSYYAAFFPGMEVEVMKKPISLKDVQRRENDFGHNQFLIDDLFTILNTRRELISKSMAYCRLGVTLEDIYPGEEWNYVFGQARPLERVGVFSFARHSPMFYDGVHAVDTNGVVPVRGMLGWLRTCRHSLEGTPRQRLPKALADEHPDAVPRSSLQRDIEWLECRREQLQALQECPPPPQPAAAGVGRSAPKGPAAAASAVERKPPSPQSAAAVGGRHARRPSTPQSPAAGAGRSASKALTAAAAAASAADRPATPQAAAAGAGTSTSKSSVAAGSGVDRKPSKGPSAAPSRKASKEAGDEGRRPPGRGPIEI